MVVGHEFAGVVTELVSMYASPTTPPAPSTGSSMRISLMRSAPHSARLSVPMSKVPSVALLSRARSVPKLSPWKSASATMRIPTVRARSVMPDPEPAVMVVAGEALPVLPSLLLSHPKVAVEGAESDCCAPPDPAIAANGSRARNHSNRKENRYG